MKYRTKPLQDVKMPAIFGCAGLLALVVLFFVINSGKKENVEKEDKLAALEQKVVYLEDRLYKIEQDIGKANNKIAELDMTLPSITENIEKQLDEFQQQLTGGKTAPAFPSKPAATSQKKTPKSAPTKVAGTKKPAVRKTVSKPAAKAHYHIVQDNETVFGIARKYGLTVEKLKKMNKLPSDSIYPDQKLRVR